jgi:hypothetical protein
MNQVFNLSSLNFLIVKIVLINYYYFQQFYKFKLNNLLFLSNRYLYLI